MDDLEMTKLCAGAMGLAIICAPTQVNYRAHSAGDIEAYGRYDPLHDDAQAMALVKRFKLNIGQLSAGMCKVFTPDIKHEADDGDLNYAIVLCVARMQQAKQ